MPRTRKTVVILLSGKAGSGKTTVAEMLEQKLTEIPSLKVFRYSFANPLKYIAEAFIGWDGKKDEKGRKLLQEQGRIGREYDENIWVKHFINQLDKKAGILPFNFAIVDDWRFPNELSYLQKNPLMNVVTVRLFGRGGLNGQVASDVSENSLPEPSVEHLESSSYSEFESMLYYDFIINNDTGVEQLNEKLDTILASIEKQYIVE
jgi:energy-coupling factor transporter ATP-binding protein EcfA2